jgi:hypothetical protein
MQTFPNQSPQIILSGKAVALILKSKALPQKIWNLFNIETLADSPALDLGNLWVRVQMQPIKLTTEEFGFVIQQAKQVISLSATLDSNNDISIFVEDGLMH